MIFCPPFKYLDGAEQIRCCKRASSLFISSFCYFPLKQKDNQLLQSYRQHTAGCKTGSHANVSSHTLALQLESISIITLLLSCPLGKSIAAPYEVKPPAPGASLLTPKNDTLCWHQLGIILLKHPFVVGLRCRFIQSTKRPFIYLRGLSGERAAPQQPGSSSGNTSSHHGGAYVLPSAVNAREIRSFYGCKGGSQQLSSSQIRQAFICNHSFLSSSGLSWEPSAQGA